MRIALSHFLNTICVKPAGSAIMAALIVLMAFQVAVPPHLAGFESEGTYEEFEEEDVDPSESTGEQSLPEFVGPLSSAPQRTESRFIQRFSAAVSQRRQKSFIENCFAAELSHRNGMGGPLRC
jgi:hypothetical protein